MAMKTLRIIYYLSREGQLEEPHLLEVPVAAFNSKCLRLIDVKKWLMLTRGKSMPASFSWSYRRNYKEGCIWQDVSADEDLILPASQGEYILKGSKVVVASKELWPAPVFAKLDQNSPGMHSGYDCTFRVEEDSMRGETKGLPAGNGQEVNVGEDCCQLTFTDPVRKSNVMCDQHSTLVDASSPCVMVNNRPLVNSDSSILQSAQTLEHICKGEETKSHCDSGTATVASIHDSCPTASSGLTLEAIQAKNVTTDSSQIDKRVVDLNVAENARVLKTVDHHIKYQTTGIEERDRQVSYLNVAENARLLQTVDSHMKHQIIGGDERDKQSNLNVVQNATILHSVDDHIMRQTSNKHLTCGAPCDATDSVDIALASKNFKRAPIKTTDLKTNGYMTPASGRAVTGPWVEKTLDHKPTKHTKSKSILELAPCKVMNANLTECEDKQIKPASKMIVMRRRIKTKWGCRYTPVWLTHVSANNVGDMSACKPQLPSSSEGIFQEIGDGITLRDKKFYNKRVSYSDKLGIQLPATMVIKDVAVHESEPLCPFHQRLAAKQVPLSSSLTPAYGHKKSTSQNLPKKTSLPVFGAEKQQQQLVEELDLFRIESGTSDISFTRKLNQSQLEMQQASKLSWHEEYSCPKNPIVHKHEHAILSQNVSRKGTKLLWEDLLQTTQDALTRQETI